jgi:hypothetical protein
MSVWVAGPYMLQVTILVVIVICILFREPDFVHVALFAFLKEWSQIKKA